MSDNTFLTVAKAGHTAAPSRGGNKIFFLLFTVFRGDDCCVVNFSHSSQAKANLRNGTTGECRNTALCTAKGRKTTSEDEERRVDREAMPRNREI